MDRLTMEYCGEYVPRELCSIDRFGGADDCDLCCEYCKATEEGNEDCTGCAINQCFNKLGEYENLEEQGKLLKPKCLPGDYVWEINRERNIISEYEVTSIRYGINKTFHYMWALRDGIYGNLDGFGDNDIGKTVFLTKSEAETALQNMEEVDAE